MKSRMLTVVAAILFAGSAVPAMAQGAIMAGLPDVLGQVIGRANGSAMRCDQFSSERERIEARAPTIARMEGYFATATAGQTIMPHFRSGPDSRWTLGETSLGEDEIGQLRDPLAVSGNSLNSEPLRDYRAGTFNSSIGQWVVNAPDGTVAGVYDVIFERRGGEWLIRELTILLPDDHLVPAQSYCREPGDMAEFDVNSSSARVTELEELVERRQANLVEAEERANRSAARAADNPNNRSLRRTAANDRESANHRAQQLAGAEQLLQEARVTLANNQSKLEADRALAGPARNAESLRIPELPLEITDKSSQHLKSNDNP